MNKQIKEMTAEEYIEQRNKKFRDTVAKKHGKDHWSKAGKKGMENRWAKYRKDKAKQKELDKEAKEITT